MELIKMSAIVILSLFTLAIFIFAVKSHRFFKTLLFHALLGLGTLAILDLTAGLTGVYIPVNPYTVIGSGVFGIPAVAAFLICNFIFI